MERFRPVLTEVLFIDMHPEDGAYEPLNGYIPLEQAKAAVDPVEHRLVKVNRVDLKRGRLGPPLPTPAGRCRGSFLTPTVMSRAPTPRRMKASRIGRCQPKLTGWVERAVRAFTGRYISIRRDAARGRALRCYRPLIVQLVADHPTRDGAGARGEGIAVTQFTA